MLEIPNAKNLPFYLIALLVSVCGGMGTAMFQQWKQCEIDKKAEKEVYEKRIFDCQEQARKDAREASAALTSYLLRQDSINRSNQNALEKAKKR